MIPKIHFCEGSGVTNKGAWRNTCTQTHISTSAYLCRGTKLDFFFMVWYGGVWKCVRRFIITDSRIGCQGMLGWRSITGSPQTREVFKRDDLKCTEQSFCSLVNHCHVGGLHTFSSHEAHKSKKTIGALPQKHTWTSCVCSTWLTFRILSGRPTANTNKQSHTYLQTL